MKHCHCHFKEQLSRFKAGKLGLLGVFLIIGHLLFHVAECLLIPIIIAALTRQDAEAIEELSSPELQETTFVEDFSNFQASDLTFSAALEHSRPLRH